jgi:hypothetical protein
LPFLQQSFFNWALVTLIQTTLILVRLPVHVRLRRPVRHHPLLLLHRGHRATGGHLHPQSPRPQIRDVLLQARRLTGDLA